MIINRRSALAAILAGGFADCAHGQNVRYPRPEGAATRFWSECDQQMIALSLRRGMRVLDAGCGNGQHLTRLAEAVGKRGEAIGIDRAAGQIEKAQQALRDAKLTQGSARVADLFAEPFPAGSFDLIWTSHVLHGLPDMGAGAEALLRMLKPGGRLVVRENRMSSSLLPYDLGFGEPGWEFRTDLQWLRWYTKNMLAGKRPAGLGWTEILKQAGAQTVQPRSFLIDLAEPEIRAQEEYFRWYLQRRYEWPGVTPEDIAVLDRLTNAKGDDYFLRRPDLYFTQLSTIFICTKAS
ncbi:MAG: class I SAM-dependent methyltransferase [Bryobacteraceae bacterium]|nr:class I SAM-dependent methyltransferase [Bryobacteraceae bacterium]